MLRVVLIAGAAGGIGRATALLLAQEGYALALLDVAPAALASVADEVMRLGCDVRAYPCSVADEGTLARTCADVFAAWGRLDGLVNAAGVGLSASVVETSPEDWRRVLEANLTGTFLVCRAAVPYMLRQGRGQIVNVVSIGGKRAFADQGAYCASKWGVLGFTHALGSEVRPRGISVTALCPGAVDTALWDDLDPSFDRTKMLRPDQVAESIRYILAQPPGVSLEEITIMPPSGIL